MNEQNMAENAEGELESRAVIKFKEMQRSLTAPDHWAGTGNLGPPESGNMQEPQTAELGRHQEGKAGIRDEDQIRAEAWGVLAEILTDENYQYLMSNWGRITDVHNGLLEECVHAAMEPVERLKEACDADDPQQMAQYADLHHVQEQMEFCRVSVREAEYLKYYSALVFAEAEWCKTFLKGGNSPRWTDGQELNHLRRRIQYEQNSLISHGFWVPPEFAELPPEMDEGYMREHDKIRQEAEAALARCFEDENYQYLIFSGDALGPMQKLLLRISPEDALEPVEKLKAAIAGGDYPAMRRYSDVEAALAKMRLCREEIAEAVADDNPF